MANTVPSPNMGLPVPSVGIDPGPDWANNINAALAILDSHNHTTGQGVQIPPSGLNINADLPINSNNLTTARSLRFTSQLSPIADPADLGCLYESGVDLYYNDGNGNQIRVTQSGSVTGSAGTITGLPSGTASASYSAGTFTFQGATNTPATMAVGPLAVGAAVANSNTVTIAPTNSLAANYNLTLPTALPVSTSFLNVDSSGNMATVGSTGSGSVVLAVSPTFTGTPNCSAGLEVAGGGTAASQAFKVAIYSQNIGPSSFQTITAPGGATRFIGVSGFWSNPNTGNTGPMGTQVDGTTPTIGCVFYVTMSNTTIRVNNFDSTTSTYYVVAYYQ